MASILRAILQEMPQPSVTEISLKITYLKFCSNLPGANELTTHWGRVTHICVVELGHNRFRLWLVACSTPSHYQNQCWNTVHWTFRNKLQWNFNRNSNIFIPEIAFETVVCKMASILSRPHWVNGSSWTTATPTECIAWLQPQITHLAITS